MIEEKSHCDVHLSVSQARRLLTSTAFWSMGNFPDRPRSNGCMMWQTRFWGAAVCAGLLLLAGHAQADQVSALRSERLVETKHRIALTLGRGHATLVVERTLFNGGPRHDEATFWIDVPEGAVATGLKTLGQEHGKPKWFAGELMEAEEAAAKYRELTGIGGYYPKDPALLSWRHQGLLALQVFPCPPGETKKVEYTLELPTSYSEGKHQLHLQPMGTESLLAQLTVRPAERGDRVFVDGREVKPGAEVKFVRSESLTLALLPSQRDFVEGTLAVQPTSERRYLRRVDLYAAPKLSEAPKKADLVVLLDGSRSVSEAMRLGSIAAAQAYLSHWKDAEVQVLVFDRKVHAPLGGFAKTDQAALDLEAFTLLPHNGSDVEAALLEADRLLAARPKGRARRIVLLSDTLTHSKMTPERLRAALPLSGALLHVGVLSGRGTSLVRFDDHPWEAVARASGGLVWHAEVEDDADSADAMNTAYEEWVRPLRIDRLSVDTHTRIELEIPEMLAEGEAVSGLALDKLGMGRVTLRGELWAEPVQRTVPVSAEATKLWSALVFGSPLLDELSEAEMMPLAMYGGAVSPVTSYLAIEPGVRPSTEGIEYGTGTGMGFGSGSGGGWGAATSVSGPPLDHLAWLDEKLSAAWRACGGRGSASVGFETTLAEVVLVDEARGLSYRDLVADRCLEDAVWDLDLPNQFESEHEGWQLFVEA